MVLNNIEVSKGERKVDLVHVEFYTRGDLKGYINCMLEDSLTGKWYETLYRVTDHDNGNDYKLVSVDYGWRLKDDSIIEKAEKMLTQYAKENNLIGLIQ